MTIFSGLGVAILVVLVAGCAPTVVTQYNGHSINVQSAHSHPDVAVRSEARRICATRGQQAEYASTSAPTGSMFLYSHMYMCLGNAPMRSSSMYQRPPGVGYLEDTSRL